MSNVNCCIRNYHYLPKLFWAERAAQAAITALAITGIIDKKIFLISITATSAIEIAALPLLAHQFHIRPGKKLSVLLLTIFGMIVYKSYVSPLLQTAAGGMNYQLCAWKFTGWNIALASTYLVTKGSYLGMKHNLAL